MSKIPTLEELLKVGAHFGHRTSKRHPKASAYIHTKRDGIHIIDLQKTHDGLVNALSFVEKTVKAGGVILFVGSKKQARKIVRQAAENCGMPFIVGRWLGGTFTNFENIVKLTNKLEKLERDEQEGVWQLYTKKEQVSFRKELAKLDETVGGIKTMKKLPRAIFVVDLKKEKTAVAEANKMHIPVIAICDTNVNPEKAQYQIPSNDDAIKTLELITNLVSETVKESRNKPETKNN